MEKGDLGLRLLRDMGAVLPAWMGAGALMIRDEYDRDDQERDVSMKRDIGRRWGNLRGWTMSFGVVVKTGGGVREESEGICLSHEDEVRTIITQEIDRV